jgi:uncharacterized protein YbcI
MTDRPTGPSTEAPDFSEGELLAEISRSLVQLHKECYGKGPTKARTYASDDLIVSVLEGGFTAGERTLRDHGREDAVVASREAFQDALRQRFIETIENLVGRKVVTFISGVDPNTETSSELFVLGPAAQPQLGDERQAVRGWGSQLRRQARVLIDEQSALREEQRALRRTTGEARADLRRETP